MPIRFRPPAAPRHRWTDWWMLLVPLLLIAAVAVADALYPPEVHLGPLLVVAPAMTAAYASARWTALVGGLSVIMLIGIGLFRSTLFTENLIVQLCALALLTVFLSVFSALRERHARELDRARAVAVTAQEVLLRPLPRRVGPLSVASHYRAAEADTRIGGDLFAAARTPHGTRIIIGDVSGRGLASISDTATLLGAFRAAAHADVSLPELVRYLEGSVRRGLDEIVPEPERAPPPGRRRGTDGGHGQRNPADDRYPAERFVTAAVLDIPDDEPTVSLVNCGHPPPLLLRDGGAQPLHTPDPAPPLGLGGLLSTPYEATRHPFAPGDLLLLYTDGLSEARDRSGAFYPLTDRAPRWTAHGTEALLRRIAGDVHAYTARPLDDDLAMVAVERARGTA